jgi:proline iminopeptidase
MRDTAGSSLEATQTAPLPTAMLCGPAAVGLAVIYACWLRPRLVRWGATDDEVDGPYPGAELVPDGERGATMAVTIDAPPTQVWPWLVQLGGDRGGWYSWDRLDNGGRPTPT